MFVVVCHESDMVYQCTNWHLCLESGMDLEYLKQFHQPSKQFTTFSDRLFVVVRKSGTWGGKRCPV